MAPLAIGLVLVAAVAHTLWNRLVHDGADRVAVLGVSGLIGALLLSPAIIWRPPTHVWGLILLSGLVEAVYALLLAAAYARGSLHVAYPIGRGTAPLLVTLTAWPLLGQRPGLPALAGAALLAAGLVCTAFAGQADGEGAAVGPALAVGAAIAGYSLIDAAAVRDAWPPAYLGAALGTQGALLALTMAVRSGVRPALARLRAAAWPGAQVGAGVVVAYGLVVTAFTLADAGRVSTLREVSVLLAVAVSGRRVRPAVWTGAGLVVAGALLTAS